MELSNGYSIDVMQFMLVRHWSVSVASGCWQYHLELVFNWEVNRSYVCWTHRMSFVQSSVQSSHKDLSRGRDLRSSGSHLFCVKRGAVRHGTQTVVLFERAPLDISRAAIILLSYRSVRHEGATRDPI